MDSLTNLLQPILGSEVDVTSFLILALVLTLGSLILGCIGRFAFGKKSSLNQSVSSAIGIFFIYAVTVVIHSFGLNLKFLVSPLPFVQISGETLHIFDIAHADYVTICGEVLNMVILAFLANLVESWMPKSKNLFAWLFFRVLSVALGIVLFAVASYFLNLYLPEGLITWAPVVLLVLMVSTLLLGALKGVVGAVLVTIEPVIGLLYTFFFATVLGKMLSRALLTTLLLSLLVYGLNYLGIAAVAIGVSVLMGYLPLMILALALWYLVGRIL